MRDNRGRKAKISLQEKIKDYYKFNEETGSEYNYMYNIVINQKAVIDNGWDLDIIDVAIFQCIVNFINHGNPKEFKDAETGTWYWVSESKILRDAPLLPLNSASPVYSRITKLISCGLLERKSDNVSTRLKLLRQGENAFKIVYAKHSKI